MMGISKLLGKSSTDNRLDADSRHIDTSHLRPDKSQSAALHVGGILRCLDKSPTGDLVVVAGEQVFKVLKVDSSTVTEECDLRVAITNRPQNHAESVASSKDRLNIRAARWMHGRSYTTVIAASAHGKVSLYDINRISSGTEVGRIHEHEREIHTLAVNPYRPESVLTACHDGNIRLFDILEPDRTPGQVFRSKNRYKANADGIRDVKWSPTRGHNFACATNNGAVQLWDRRNPNAPVVNLKTAHRNACMSISWHYDGTHIISGGQDQKAHVWELLHTSDKKQSPKFTFSTPAPISRISWRPHCWSATAQGRRAAQVAVAYDDQSAMNSKVSSLHIWDLARPSLPYKEISVSEASPSAFVWHDQDLIWSVCANGRFDQVDMAFAPKTIDRRSLSTFDFSSSGETLMCLEQRRGRTRLSPAESYNEQDQKDNNKSLSQSQSHSRSPRRLSIHNSRSDSDEDVVGSFLGGRTRQQTRRHNSKTSNNLSTTPPSIASAKEETMDLLAGVKVTGTYKPQQTMAFGKIPATAVREIYRFMASACLETIMTNQRDTSTPCDADSQIGNKLGAVLEHFATAAQAAGLFRLAQTWKILAYTMCTCLERRAVYHRDLRLAKVNEQIKFAKRHDSAMRDIRVFHEDRPSISHNAHRIGHVKSPSGSVIASMRRSILSEELDSTSNMTTPTAGPIKDASLLDKTINNVRNMEVDELNLSPSIHVADSRVSPSSPSAVDPGLCESSSEGYDFYDMASFAPPNIDISGPPQRKQPFRLDIDYDNVACGNATSALHNSVDSFDMFPSSQDSRPTHESVSMRNESTLGSEHQKTDTGLSWDSNASLNHVAENGSGDCQITVNSSSDSIREQDVVVEDLSLDAEMAALRRARAADEMSGTIAKVNLASEYIIDHDYYPQPSDPDFMPDPIDPHVLFQRSIEFELQTGVQNAALMVLTLKPYLKDGAIDEHQASAIVTQYHQRLISMQLFYEAALLRKLSFPAYPSTYTQGLDNVIIGLMCPSCRRPVGNEFGNDRMSIKHCSACRTDLVECAVCQEADPPAADSFDVDEIYTMSSSTHSSSVSGSVSTPASYVKAMSTSWWYCQGCGHGGHTKCMQDWHNTRSFTSSASSTDDLTSGTGPSEGCCPQQGCLHPCLPGKYREDFLLSKRQMLDSAGRTARVARNASLSGIDNEGNGSLSFGFESMKRVNSTGIIREELHNIEARRSVHTSAGMNSLERRKSVKVIAPGEENVR